LQGDDRLRKEEAWQVTATAGESVIDVAGVNNTKRYSWDTASGAVIKSNDWENIEFKEPMVDGGGFTTRAVKLKKGEVEVKVRNDKPAETKFKVEAADFLDAVSIETHYWVGYNPETKQSGVIVYEGKVEVKTRDGKTITVEPKDGKPGIVVIFQKLSPVKLAIWGLILAVAAGGMAWFIKRRSQFKLSKKKK